MTENRPKLDRINAIGLLMFAAGLHLYGWFVAQMEMPLLPLVNLWIALGHIMIIGWLLIAVLRTAKLPSEYISYNLAAIGDIMSIASLFPMVVYSQKYNIHVPGSRIIGLMFRLFGLNAPITSFVETLFILGFTLLTVQAIVKVVRSLTS